MDVKTLGAELARKQNSDYKPTESEVDDRS